MQKITIGIPAYNAHKTIKDTLTSITKLDNIGDTKVIIADDCSSTDYNSIIQEFDRLLDITVIRMSHNQGPGVARNTILDHCQTEFIAFIDADDIFIAPDFLTQGIAALNENPQAAFYMSTFLYESMVHVRTPTLEIDWLHGKLYRLSTINKHGIRFNNTFFMEDLEFNLELLVSCETDPIRSNSISYLYQTNSNSLLSAFESYSQLYIRSIRVGVDIRIKVLSKDALMPYRVKDFIQQDIIRYYDVANSLYETFKIKEPIASFFFRQLNRYYKAVISKYDVEIKEPEIRHRHIDFKTFYSSILTAESK